MWRWRVQDLFIGQPPASGKCRKMLPLAFQLTRHKSENDLKSGFAFLGSEIRVHSKWPMLWPRKWIVDY